ncbi:Transglycosylase SLT domain-containing protein [Cognatiyoonia koreensis]|uniref:Transglycosylase SLT domain-containing protein n=1 Tax=Cognatiyoonia koreensis TaxID=364200 RepID=A0A1I0MPH4_9RHOB|nr:lytic transglycosylase domain-containing protein [Cognatiyoonia koreensis]SEV89810.1 Transglycosylase SLT domain-containing protein [Cognatiyoonia koreensis]
MNLFIKWFALAATLAFASVAHAEQHRLQPEFTFKRIGVATGTGNRITVQIRPNAPSAPSSPAAAGTGGGGAPAAPRVTGLEWFWEAVSPDLTASQPGRLLPALVAIDQAPSGKDVPIPRLQTLHDIATAHGATILRETVGTDVSPALVLALISVESAGRPDAESTAGAQGLMQLMPATAERFGVTDRLVAEDNIKGGVAYLNWLMNHFNNDPILALAGYNAGEGAVRNNNGVPPYPETRAYVPKVLAAFALARGLCQTPPELATDGCVFVSSR